MVDNLILRSTFEKEFVVIQLLIFNKIGGGKCKSNLFLLQRIILSQSEK